jgi:hypothetical protein
MPAFKTIWASGSRPSINICGPTVELPEETMSKGLNQKKDAKKKPAKSMKEKRAEKQAKRQSRG